MTSTKRARDEDHGEAEKGAPASKRLKTGDKKTADVDRPLCAAERKQLDLLAPFWTSGQLDCKKCRQTILVQERASDGEPTPSVQRNFISALLAHVRREHPGFYERLFGPPAARRAATWDAKDPDSDMFCLQTGANDAENSPEYADVPLPRFSTIPGGYAKSVSFRKRSAESKSMDLKRPMFSEPREDPSVGDLVTTCACCGTTMRAVGTVIWAHIALGDRGWEALCLDPVHGHPFTIAYYQRKRASRAAKLAALKQKMHRAIENGHWAALASLSYQAEAVSENSL